MKDSVILIMKQSKRTFQLKKVIVDKNIRVRDDACDSCCIGKATKAACKPVPTRQSKDVCELIHSDLCGPMPVESIGKSKYFITFTDDYSRRTIVQCVKSKTEVRRCIQEYIAEVERQTGKKVRRFRTDNGLEFCNKEIYAYFKSLGIKHERSNVETPQMNGVAEEDETEPS